MKAQAFIAHILKCMGGEIHGRIQLQKLIYFCKAYGITADVNYRLYLYGPYSQQVSDALEDGVMEDIFYETKGSISKGIGFDEYVGSFSDENRMDKKESEILSKVIDKFGSIPIDQLEILATTFFVHRQQSSLFGSAEKDVVLDKVRRAKASRFTEEQIVSAYGKMEEICFPLEKEIWENSAN